MGLRELYNNKKLLAALKQLYQDCSDELALRDMKAGEDVSYVVKQGKVFDNMISKMEKEFGEKKKSNSGVSRSI